MTEDDIFRLVRQADGILVRSGFFPAHCVMLNDQLIRFAALVAAAEREACAQVCEDQDTGQDLPYDLAVIECAKAIRARGEQ